MKLIGRGAFTRCYLKIMGKLILLDVFFNKELNRRSHYTRLRRIGSL